MTSPDSSGDQRADAGVDVRAGEYTGRYLVLLAPDDTDAGMAFLADEAGVASADRPAAADSDAVSAALGSGGSVVLDELGVAVVEADPDQRPRLLQAAAEAPQVLAIEPERVVSIFGDPSVDFLLGFRAGVNALVEEAIGTSAGAGHAEAPVQDWDEALITWGLQACRVPESCDSGAGVKLAVLDTGFDLAHPDFAGRSVTTASFIAGEEVQDGHGHGTHCIGTACGPRHPTRLPRYGIAGESLIHAGKVLSNAGSGADGGILAGINWAVAEGCRIVSMSLGARTAVGDTYSRIYEAAAQRALAKGTIIVAAAGNESRRPDQVNPVGHPANCPSILAVASLNRDLSVSSFSCAGLNPDGGQIDVAAPGRDVLSSWPEPTTYRRISGTSMATPHVAGILALYAGADPDAPAAELKNRLLAYARRLSLPATDVGAGLAQAR